MKNQNGSSSYFNSKKNQLAEQQTTRYDTKHAALAWVE